MGLKQEIKKRSLANFHYCDRTSKSQQSSILEISPVTFHPLANLSPQERQNRIKQVLGAWQDDPEIDAIFAEIDRDRHSYYGRQIDSLDD